MAHLLLPVLALLACVCAGATAEDAGCPASYRCGDAVDIRYPFWVDAGNGTSACGYPNLRLECRGDAPVLPLPAGDFGLTGVDYAERTATLVDIAAIATSCPRVAAGNLTLPPPLSLADSTRNLTFLVNCTFVGVMPEHAVPCLQRGRLTTYFFRDGDFLYPLEGLCEEVVGVPVQRPLDDLLLALEGGFHVSWTPAAGADCRACEAAGGRCGHRQASTFTCFTGTPAPAPDSASGGGQRSGAGCGGRSPEHGAETSLRFHTKSQVPASHYDGRPRGIIG